MHDCMEHNPKPKGYSRFLYNGKYTYAHRVVFSEVYGVSLDEMKHLEVRHSCDNPRCLNPSHLSLGTHSENMADKKTRGRAKGINSIVNLEESRRMREAGMTYQEIANRYGVSRQAIHDLHKKNT